MDDEWICECDKYDVHGPLGCDRPTSRGIDSALCRPCEEGNCGGVWRPTPMAPAERGYGGPIKPAPRPDSGAKR